MTEKNKLKILFLVMIPLVSIVVSGCIFDETQGVEISGDVGYSVGAISENQTDVQKIQWTTSIGNNGKLTAKDLSCKVILNPEVGSRLMDIDGNTAFMGNLEADTWEGFKGNATFDATNTTKHEIDDWGNLVQVRVTWEENGKTFEKIIPDLGK